MKVYGTEICENHLENVKTNMMGKDRFTLSDLTNEIINEIGFSGSYVVVHRCGDRLLQKWKKKGLVKFENRKWAVIK